MVRIPPEELRCPYGRDMVSARSPKPLREGSIPSVRVSRPGRLAARTPAPQAGDAGSSPARGTCSSRDRGVSGSTRRRQRCGPGSTPGGRSHAGLWCQRPTFVACTHAIGVRLPGAPLCLPAGRKSAPAHFQPRGSLKPGRCRGRGRGEGCGIHPADVPTAQKYSLSDAPGARPGCLLGEAGSIPVESA